MRLFQACQPCDGTLEIPARASQVDTDKTAPLRAETAAHRRRQLRHRHQRLLQVSIVQTQRAAIQPGEIGPFSLGHRAPGRGVRQRLLKPTPVLRQVVEQLIKPGRAPLIGRGRRRHRQRVEHIQPVGVQPIDKRLPKPGIGDQEIRNAQRGKAERFCWRTSPQ